MRKNLIVLAISLLVLNMFNINNHSFNSFEEHSLFYNYLDFQDTISITVEIDNKPSVLGLVTNFFMGFGLDSSQDVNQEDYNVDFLSKLDSQDDLSIDIVVDDNGVQEVILNNVQFDNNSFVLKKESIKELNEFSVFLNNNTDLKILIEGHTDNIGSRLDNKKLSNLRAKSVFEYLLEKDVAQDQLVAYYGYGEDKPIESNETLKGRSLNRRTSFKIYNSDSIIPQDDIIIEDPVINEKSAKKDVVKKKPAKKEIVKKKPAKKEVTKMKPAKKEVVNKQPAKKEVVNKQPAKKEVVNKEPNKKNTVDNTSKKRTVRKKVKKTIKNPVEQESLPTDQEIIQESSNISESAKKLILKMLDDEVISMSDVEMLLMKYPNKTIKKKQVNELVNASKTKSKKKKRK